MTQSYDVSGSLSIGDWSIITCGAGGMYPMTNEVEIANTGTVDFDTARIPAHELVAFFKEMRHKYA